MNMRELFLATASVAPRMGVVGVVTALNKPAPAGTLAGPSAMGDAPAPRSHNRQPFTATPGGGGADDGSGLFVFGMADAYNARTRLFSR